MHEGARAVPAGMNSMESGARHRQDGCRYVAEWRVGWRRCRGPDQRFKRLIAVSERAHSENVMANQEQPDPQFDATTARLLRREALRRAAAEMNTTSGPGLENVLARISAEVPPRRTRVTGTGGGDDRIDIPGIRRVRAGEPDPIGCSPSPVDGAAS